jgi:hypothetical protein
MVREVTANVEDEKSAPEASSANFCNRYEPIVRPARSKY